MDPSTARQNLEAERRRLLDLHRSGELEPAEHGDAGDEGAELFEREVERALDGEVLAELAALDAAVARVDAGTYGRCDACAEPIPDERLAAVPATRFCVAHETEAEVHLGAVHVEDGHDPAEFVRREAQGHLPAADLDPEDPDEADRGAEDAAVHVRT